MGIDAARGLAVLGMFAAHVGFAGDDFWSGTGWLAAANGRSAAMFALLAGVSMALMSGGEQPAAGDAARAARRRIAVRAGAVAALGYSLVALGTPIAIILPAYAVMFLLALPFLTLRPLVVASAAGGFALLGPVLVAAAGGRGTGLGVDPVGILLTGYYPAAVWMAYVLAGLTLGRTSLRRAPVQARMVAGGTGLALLGYGVGSWVSATAPAELAERFSIAAHSDTTPEVLGNLGVAIAVLGLLMLAAATRPGRVALSSLAAVGAMALTVYTGQIVAIAIIGPAVVLEQTTNGTLIAFTVVTLVACTLWVRLLGRGPLERALRALTRAVVRDPTREAVS